MYPGKTTSRERSATATSVAISAAMPVQVTGDSVPQVELHVERHLVVAAASRVYLPPDGTDEFGQAALHGHVHVFVVQVPGEGSRGHLAAHRLKAVQQDRHLGRREHADGAQHAHVRPRPTEVVRREHVVERQGRVQAVEQRGLRVAEPAAPRSRQTGA